MLRLLVLALTLTAAPTFAQSFDPITFVLDDGDSLAAEQGEIWVPENRSAPDSRRIPVRFVRLASRAAAPAAPIVYLAGGPGGSGTAAGKGRRAALFDRLRDVADVILLDQRGTGLSDTLPPCPDAATIPPDQPTTRDMLIALHREAFVHCRGIWDEAGVDLQGYTTWESAADIDAVRQALGVERVNLLGISYGTHLALATLKRFPDRVDRLVLASTEGLDDTVKRPARTDAYFARLQAAIDADSAAAARYPDVRGLIEGVLARVEADPPRLTVRRYGASPFDRTLGTFELQLITGHLISDPSRVSGLLDAYARAAEGDFSPFAWYLRPTISLNAMSFAMDLASGLSQARHAHVVAEAETALLSDALNFPMPHLDGLLPTLDDVFRAPVQSDRPALFLSGTLDGRTYPEAHAESAAGFSNGAVVTIEHAGHNLFFSHPSLPDRLAAFFAGTPATPATLTAELPDFSGR